MVIPNFTLPITDIERENIYCWTRAYRDFSNVWLNTGELEMPAYLLLAEPDSSLSIRGRKCCSVIEKATGVPTYYFLIRYYGRDEAGERERRCPGCGKPWFVQRPNKQISMLNPVLEDNRGPWWEFDFMCKKCRLVSHGCDCLDLRHAKIGEPRKSKK
jgi:predicted  nucleic acid-binding Zn ribbon protein